MAELAIPPSISDARSAALLTLVDRLGLIDLVPLLVYRIDSVPASALPFLAWQFDILSPLWQAVAPAIDSVDALTAIDPLSEIDTLAEAMSQAAADAVVVAERSLIKLAIAFHRYRGTPWAVKNALATLGWESVSIVEGQASWGGTAYPSNEGWAVFRVFIQLGDQALTDPGAVATAVATVNFFKPARAWLDSLWFVLPKAIDAVAAPLDRLTLSGIAEYQLDNAPSPSEAPLSLNVTLAPLIDSYGPAVPLYDAHYRHSGITHGASEPAVADSALTVNGAAVLEGG